jgi:indolepyruvate ferredoxin oxidoreductase, alpha subunit
MAERSFEREVQDLRLQAGEIFRGEGILAVTKALLQSGVSYVAGYQGAPISHLMDVLADAKDVLNELGVHFETSASEAAAAATLSASVMYPVRGAVTWKSTAGTNVAADALSNLASSGVTGGALIVIGEDYGEGSSIMQERTHAFAMKSQIWLLDPRPNLSTMVRMVEEGFELSEASNSPVMLEVRIRTCHVHGQFVAKDNQKPAFTLRQALENPVRDVNRIVLPPASYMQEMEKLEKRWPAAVEFIKSRKLNEFFGPKDGAVGVMVLGGLFNGVLRALQQLGLADVYGESSIPIYVLNVAYPVIDDEVVEFCLGKSAVLMVEEGAPDYLEQALNTLLRRRDMQTKVAGKDVLPMGGEYTAPVVVTGLRAFLLAHAPELLRNQPPVPDPSLILAHEKVKALAKAVPPLLHRLPGAADLRGDETGRERAWVSSHLGRHRLPPVLDPAPLQYRHDDDGLWTRSRLRLGFQCEVGQAGHFRHGRWRLLAQRACLLDRQFRIQQAGRRHHHRRQLLFRRDWRPGHSFLAGA